MLGVGTPKGAPVQQEDGSFLKDDQGGILLPRLDESGLRRFAAEIGAGYQRLRPNDRDLDSLGLLARGGTLEEDRENACCACSAGPTRVTGCSCRCSCWPPVPDGAAGCSACRC